MDTSKGIAFLCLFIFHGLLSANNLEDTIYIELKKRVLFAGSEYRLRNIAYIKSNMETVRTDLGETVIGLSPRVGYSVLVRRLNINARLEKAFPRLNKYIKWRGPAVTTLQATGVLLEKSKYVYTAETALNNYLVDRFKDFKIRHIGKLRDIYIPSGRLIIKSRNIKRSDISKRTCVWIDLLIQGNIYQSIPVWFDVKVIENAYVTQYSIKKGQVVDIDALVKMQVDVSKVKGVPITHKDELLEKRAKVSLYDNQIITKGHLEEIPLVQKNNNIVIVANDRNVQVQVKGIALEDGKISDMIKVRSKSSKRDINAIVVEKNRVEVK